MKRERLSLLMLVFVLTTALLAADPPVHADHDWVNVPVHYSDQAVIISTQEGVALVRFTDAVPQGREYVFRFLPSGEGGKEERGEGKVFEKYNRKPALPPSKEVEVTNAGGQLKVVAGKIALAWSLGSDSSGWLYFMPETERVQLVNADSFDTLKLSRFAK